MKREIEAISNMQKELKKLQQEVCPKGRGGVTGVDIYSVGIYLAVKKYGQGP